MGSKRQRWVQTLQNAWLARGWLARLLLPLAWLYGLAWKLRSALWRCGVWRSTRLPVPVWVVGNVVAGGAGKTPTVIDLVRYAQARGWHPGVVARGHGGQVARRSGAVWAAGKDSDPALVGDEPALIARRTGVPVYVGRQRVAAARALLAAHPQVNLLLSDDGMQHWALARDLTVLVFDRRGCGNGWLLPAGPLRQPWPCPLPGQDAVLVLQTGLEPDTAPAPGLAAGYPAFAAVRALSGHACDRHGRSAALADWVRAGSARCASDGQQLAPAGAASSGNSRPTPALGALAGIAQPEVFFSMLRQRGLELQHTLALPDHADCATLLAALAQAPCGLIWLCTEKDAVKLFPALRSATVGTPPEVWAVGLLQQPEAAFYAALERLSGP